MAETLKFLIEVATEKGEAAVDRLGEKFGQLEEKGKTAADSTSLAMGQAGLAVGAVGTAITAALVAMAVHTANLGDELNDMSKKTGVSVEQLQILGFAAEQSGSSMEGVATGLKFIARNAVAAAEGNQQAAQAFKAIGVSVREANGEMKDTDKLFREIATAFSRMRDGAGKTALALQLAGRSGAELIPVFNEGAEGIDRMGKQLESVGAIMTGVTARASDDFNDQLHLLEKGMEGVTIQIGSVLIPILRSFVEALVPVVSAISAWVKAHPDLTKAIFSLGLALAGTGGLLAAVSAVSIALPLLASGLTGAWMAAAGPIAVFAALAAGAYAFRYELGAVILAVGAGFVEMLGGLMGALSKVAGVAGFGGLSEKLASAQKYLIDTGANFRDMSKTMMAGEPVIIGNTKAVDKFQESLKKAAPVVTEMSKEMKEYYKLWEKVVDITDKNKRALDNYVESGKVNMKIQRDTSFLIRDLIDKTEGYSGAQFLLGQTAKGTSMIVSASMAKISQDANHAMDEYNIRAKKVEEEIKAKRLETYNDLRDSAGQVFDALITKGGNAIGTITGLFKAGFLSLGRSVFEDVTATLFTPLKMAFDDFFTGLLESAGLKKLMSGLASRLSGIIPGLGSSAASTATSVGGSVASTAASSAGGVASAVGGTASSVGSAVSQLASTVNMISGIASAVGSIMGAIGTMRLEGTMNAVEKNTRYTSIDTEIIINDFWWPVLGILQRGEEYWHTATMQLDAIYNLMAAANPAALAAVQGQPGGPTGTAPATVSIPVSVENNFSFSTQEVSRQFVRDFIIPEITEVLVDGVNTVREKWSSILTQNSGLVSQAVTTGG